MTTAQAIMRRLKSLPDQAQREVLDFVEFIESHRKGPTVASKDDKSWSNFSLASAMRGMEDEDTSYTLADLKESFSCCCFRRPIARCYREPGGRPSHGHPITSCAMDLGRPCRLSSPIEG